MIISVQFIISNICKQPRCSVTDALLKILNILIHTYKILLTYKRRQNHSLHHNLAATGGYHIKQSELKAKFQIMSHICIIEKQSE